MTDKHRNKRQENGSVGFRVGSGRDHTGTFKRQSAGRLGSPAGPAVSLSTGRVLGQCYSETQVSEQSWFTGTLWSSCIRKKSYSTVNFNIWNHVSNTCLCGRPPERLPGWEIHSFTDESEFKSRSRSLMWGAVALFCLLKSWNHHETMITHRSSQSTGNGSRNSVYEREVYKDPTGKFMFKMCLRKSMPLCSQWQPQWEPLNILRYWPTLRGGCRNS